MIKATFVSVSSNRLPIRPASSSRPAPLRCSLRAEHAAADARLRAVVAAAARVSAVCAMAMAMLDATSGGGLGLMGPPAAAYADEQPLVFDHDQTLSGADFKNRKDLKGAIFSKANCKGALFTDADLTNAQLDDANMMGANLEGVIAVNVSATKTKFQKANLRNADFTNANLVSAVFDGADIQGADFTDSLLDRVATVKLCKVASGTNPRTGVSTAESLMCPE